MSSRRMATVQAAPAHGRVVFVNRFFDPDQSASSQMLTDLAKGLAGRGFLVVVVTSRRLFDSDTTLPGGANADGVQVRRVWMTRVKRGGLAGRAIDYLSFYGSVATVLRREVRRGDVVVCMTDPPLLSLVVEPIARRRGARVVNWVQDLYPDIAEALDLTPRILRPLLRAVARMRDRTLFRAEANIAIGDAMAAHLDDSVHAPHRTLVIRNWANGAVLARTEGTRAAHRAALGLDEHGVVIAHAGNLGRAHDAGTLLRAIERLERDVVDPKLRPTWLFIGGGAGYAWLKRSVHERGLTSARFAPYVPRERLGDVLRAADAHLVSLRADMEGLLVPSKYYGILAAGRPVVLLGSPDGELARAIARDGCGHVVPPGAADQLTGVVLDLASDPERREALGRAARSAFETRYDMPIAVEAWSRVLSRICAIEGPATAHGNGRAQSGAT